MALDAGSSGLRVLFGGTDRAFRELSCEQTERQVWASNRRNTTTTVWCAFGARRSRGCDAVFIETEVGLVDEHQALYFEVLICLGDEGAQRFAFDDVSRDADCDW